MQALADQLAEDEEKLDLSFVLVFDLHLTVQLAGAVEKMQMFLLAQGLAHCRFHHAGGRFQFGVEDFPGKLFLIAHMRNIPSCRKHLYSLPCLK